MGSGWSDPKYVARIESGRDMWGHLPSAMLHAPQHGWSQVYTEGPPALNRHGTRQYVAGQMEDRLETFGGGPVGQAGFGQKGVQSQFFFGKYPNIVAATGVDQFPTLQRNAFDLAKTCDPTSYPNCSLANFRINAPVLQRYQDFYYTKHLESYPDLVEVISATASTPAEKQIDVWRQTIDLNTSRYANGDFDALSEVNDKDTSDYDPCGGPTSLDKFLPPLVAIAGTALVNLYVFDLVPLTLTGQEKGAFSVGVFATLFNFTKSELGGSAPGGGGGVGSGEDPDVRKYYTEKAATALTLSFGAGAGFVLIDLYSQLQDQTWTPYFPIATSLAAKTILQPIIAKSFLVGSFAAGPLFLIVDLVRWVSRVFCKWSNYSQSACDDSDAHPKARLWDVSSIAAMLTDEACAEEEWDRGDPRAQFVYRSLITNPSMMAAATFPAELPGNYGKVGVNPIGTIIPTHESVFSYLVNSNSPPTVRLHVERTTNAGITGKIHDGWNQDTANRFACQNWETLIRATENTAKNPDPEDRDLLLSQTLKTWVDAAVAAAKNPMNLWKQDMISGFRDHVPAVPYACADYLANCNKDFNTSTGFGFDRVVDRGRFASFFMNVSDQSGECTGVQKTIVYVNSLFNTDTFPTLESAWTHLLAVFNEGNLAASARYLNDTLTRGFAQLDSYSRWKGNFTGLDQWLVALGEFTEDPYQKGGGGFNNPLKPNKPMQEWAAARVAYSKATSAKQSEQLTHPEWASGSVANPADVGYVYGRVIAQLGSGTTDSNPKITWETAQLQAFFTTYLPKANDVYRAAFRTSAESAILDTANFAWGWKDWHWGSGRDGPIVNPLPPDVQWARFYELYARKDITAEEASKFRIPVVTPQNVEWFKGNPREVASVIAVVNAANFAASNNEDYDFAHSQEPRLLQYWETVLAPLGDDWLNQDEGGGFAWWYKAVWLELNPTFNIYPNFGW